METYFVSGNPYMVSHFYHGGNNLKAGQIIRLVSQHDSHFSCLRRIRKVFDFAKEILLIDL